MKIHEVVLVFIVSCTVVNAAFGPKKLYTMDLPVTPVSVKVIGRQLLIVGPWYIGGISNIQWKFRQPSRMKPSIINKDIPNPRAIGKIPANAFSKRASTQQTYWVASWGTNETSGAMYVMKPTTTYSIWKDISIDSGWNYERSQWIDMDRNGRIDCLTARHRGGVGQLLWFSQPAGQTLWGQQIIHEGMADANFIGFVKGKKTYILVAGLQFSALGLYWTMSRSNLWSSSRLVRQRVVDNYGKFYDVQYIDLNRDGRPDVLTTTVNIGNSRGHVLGYEVPDDIQNKIWNRRVLAAGFQGDYSPGKATAFWPNKWKKKADRPSVFLSGAGAETLFILTPKPARSGWGYIKSSVKAGVGMIGLPYIGDIDGDSYPEVFVPQGNKLHVFSYDYNAAVAEPPAEKNNAGKVTPRPVVKFVPPFFRPTTAPKPPLIPNGLPSLPPLVPRGSRTGPASSNGMTDEESNLFGSKGILPSDPQGSSSSGGTGSSSNLPPLPPLTGLQGSRAGGNNGGGSSSNPAPSIPRYNPPSLPSENTETGGVNGGTGLSDGFSLRPVMTNVGPAYVPVRNPSVSFGGSNVQQSSPQQNSPIQNPLFPGTWPNGGQSPVIQNQVVPIGGGGGGVNNNAAPPPIGTPNQNIIPIGGGSDPGQYPNNNRIMSNNIVPLGGGMDPGSAPMEPVFEDFTSQPHGSEYFEEYDMQALPSIETPANLVLSITSDSFRYREEAADACSFENKVLCDLRQLEASISAGPIPLIEWGWFSMEGRAAQIEDCMPGEVKYPGYKCHNGVVGHLQVKATAELKGYCCSIMRGANVTDRKFSNYHDAEKGCKQLSSHICSLDEMMKVWEMSSYKSDDWGWYRDDMRLIKMVHTCNPREVLWPGYECLYGKLATSVINSHVQETAYCCKDSSGQILKFQIAVVIFSIIISFFVTP